MPSTQLASATVEPSYSNLLDNDHETALAFWIGDATYARTRSVTAWVNNVEIFLDKGDTPDDVRRKHGKAAKQSS